MEKGAIIWLNGVSSTGKSTLAAELQRQLPAPFYCIAQDVFTDVISPWHTGNYAETESFGLWHNSINAMYHTVGLYADLGLNVVVDDCIIAHPASYQDRLLRECAARLAGYPVLFVRVDCPLEELLRREKDRGDRDGTAAWQWNKLYPKEPYDLAVNTFTHTTGACAAAIVEALEKMEPPGAFAALAEDCRQRSP